MFQFNPKLKRLDIPAKNILRLQHSLGDVQIALPGITAQHAKAYVCAFDTEHGLRVTVAFHLRDVNNVVFYLNDNSNISRKDLGAVMHEGLWFAETLGFILVDLDIHRMEPAKRHALWESLPLKNLPKPVVPEKLINEKKPANAQTGTENQSTLKSGFTEKGVADKSQQHQTQSVEEIDLGLPRAIGLAAMRRKKNPPTAEELEAKRKSLRENLGRFLSSM